MPQQSVDDWQDATDDWQDVADEPEPVATATDPSQMSDLERTVLGMRPQSKGLLQQWDENVINQPLSRHIKRNGQQIFDPKAAADYYDNPADRTEDQWKIPSWVPIAGGGTLRSLGYGMLEGAGNVVEGLTTPLNIATAGAGGVYNRAAKTATTLPGLTAAAYTTAPKVANVARRTTQALSAPMVASGAARASEGYRTGEYGDIPMGIAEMAGGAAGAMLPKIGGGKAAPIMPDELPLPGKKSALPKVDEEGNLAVNELMAVRKAQQRAREGLGPEEIQPQAAAPIVPEAAPNLDPNFAGGEGDPMLAGSQPYKAAPVASGDMFEIPAGTAKLQAESQPHPPSDWDKTNTGGDHVFDAEPPPKTKTSPAPFNPATLEFVDPKTGEIKPAGKANPGDVPLQRDADSSSSLPQGVDIPRSVLTRYLDYRKEQIGNFKQPISFNEWKLDDVGDSAPSSLDIPAASDNIDVDTPPKRAGRLAQFAKNLIKDESGEFNPDWAEEFRRAGQEVEPELPAGSWGAQNSVWGRRPGEAPIVRTFEPRMFGERAGTTPTEAEAVALGNTGYNIGSMPGDDVSLPWRRGEGEGGGVQIGKTLDELEATKRTPGMKRLGAMLGADMAAKLKSGEVKIEFNEKAPRSKKGKKLPPEEIEWWNEWGDNQVKNVRPNPNKAGLTVQEPMSYDPNKVEMEYRDAQGNPQGVLRTNRDGTGISVLAVDSKLGLGRGPIMFKLMKEALERGITEPAGDTSPSTKNFIERIKKILLNDKGEMKISGKSAEAVEIVATKINKLIDELGGSSFGKAVGKFLKDDDGSFGPPDDIKPGKRISLNSDPGITGEIVSGPFESAGEKWWNVKKDGVEGAAAYGRHPEHDLINVGTGGPLSIETLKQAKPPIPKESHVAEAMKIPFVRVKRQIAKIIEASYDNLPDDEWRTKFANTIGEQVTWELRNQAAWAEKQNYALPGQEKASKDAGKYFRDIADQLDDIPATPEKLTVIQQIRKFFVDETGEGDIGPAGEVGPVRKRLRELYDKGRDNKLTMDDVREGQKLTKHLNDPLAKYNNAENIFPEDTAAYRKARNEGEAQLRKEGYDVDMEGNVTQKSPQEKMATAELEKLVGGKKEFAKLQLDNILDGLKRFLKDETGEGDIGPPKLPKELRGAKPRFNVGADSYMPNFADDLDKALYIVSQNIKSRADAQYMKFVQDQTGLSEVAARNLGQKIRGVIKKAVVGKETGKIDIPPVARAKQLEAQAAKRTAAPPEPAKPAAPAKPALGPKEYIAGKPQVDTGPLVPGNVKPAAPEVVASLAARLKKATEDAGTPNAVAAEDISKLIDEATQVMNNMPEGPEKPGIIRRVLSANKALLTSGDVSAPGRQGKAFILNKAWWTSLDDMVRAWGSKTAADNINQSIIDHPSGYFEKPIGEAGKQGKSFAEKMGLDMAATEETFNSALGKNFRKYSLIDKAGRAHTAFLNKLRSDQFVSMMELSKKAGKNPESDIALAKSYAKFINDGTGRGSLNVGRWKLERNLGTLNDVFFAPKNMSGQIRTWNAVLNPHKYWMADSVVRKQALKSLFAVAGMGLGIGEMARLAGAQISDDPTNSDFRKVRIGNLRIDMFGGYQQFPVAAMKFITGQSTSPETPGHRSKTTDLNAGKFGQQTRATVAEKFFINRLSPVGSFIWAWASNREFDGQPFEVKRALFERTFPIASKDIFDLAQEDPLIATMLTPTTLMGLTGATHYTGR